MSSDSEFPLTSRKGFMVRVMETLQEWGDDNEIDAGISVHDEYDLAERVWGLWQEVGKAQIEEREGDIPEPAVGHGCPYYRSGLCIFSIRTPEERARG